VRPLRRAWKLLPDSVVEVLSISRDLHSDLVTIFARNLVFLFFSLLARGGSRPSSEHFTQRRAILGKHHLLIRTESEETRDTVVYLLFKTEEVRTNNCHYQEIPSRNRNHTSHHQFKISKLIRKTSYPKPTQRIAKERKKTTEEKAQPSLLSDYLGMILEILRLLPAITNFPFSVDSPNGSSVVLWCRPRKRAREKGEIVPIEPLPPLSAKTKQQPPL